MMAFPTLSSTTSLPRKYSDSTLPTVGTNSDSESDCSDHIVAQSRPFLRRKGDSLANRLSSYFLEPNVSRGHESLPLQLHARKLLKFLILVPLSAVGMLIFSAQYVTPFLRDQGVYSFGENLFWNTIVKNPLAFALLVALPLVLALSYDLAQEICTMVMLVRGRSRRSLPAHMPRLIHGIIVCNYKEPIEVLRATVDSIAKNTLSQACFVILACEERDPTAEATFRQLQAEYKNSFLNFIMTKHSLQEGEVVGKSSNENFACRQLYNIMQEQGVDPFQVMVTTCDADSLFDKVYFEHVEAEYCRMPDGRRFIYNAPINTYRNLGECNLLVKIFEISRCQFDCFRGFNFRPAQSNYSLTLGFAQEINFWDPSNTSEDFHTTIKAMAMTGKGRHVVVPVWSFILNDSVTGFHDRWVQAKRHMWGIEEAAFTLLMFPMLRINLWFSLFSMVGTQMFSTCTPSFLYLAFPAVRAVFWSLRPESQRLLVGLVLASVVYGWVKAIAREVFLYRYILSGRKLMMRRTAVEWLQIVALWPILSEVSVIVFACLATWRVLIHAVFHETLTYVTAPKALNATESTASDSKPKKSI